MIIESVAEFPSSSSVSASGCLVTFTKSPEKVCVTPLKLSLLESKYILTPNPVELSEFVSG